MSLKSLSTKLYLGIAVAALVMWLAGVSGGTILTLAAVGFMLAMHAGGHGGHGGGSHGEHAHRDDGDAASRHAGQSSTPDSSGTTVTHTEADVQPKHRGGCH